MAHHYTLLTNDLTGEAQSHDQLLQKETTSSRSDSIGFSILQSLHRDVVILMLCKAVRMFGFGFLSVMVNVLTLF